MIYGLVVYSNMYGYYYVKPLTINISEWLLALFSTKAITVPSYKQSIHNNGDMCQERVNIIENDFTNRIHDRRERSLAVSQFYLRFRWAKSDPCKHVRRPNTRPYTHKNKVLITANNSLYIGNGRISQIDIEKF